MTTAERLGGELIDAETIETVSKIEALFQEVYEIEHCPNKSQCYPVAVAVNVVQKSPAPAVKNERPGYVQSRATFKAMQRLIDERKKAYEVFPDVRLPADVEAINSLAALEKALADAEGALCPSNRLAGERESARWHQPARFLAIRVEEALLAAGHVEVKRDRDGSFIKMMQALLKLVGENREIGAIAAALAKPTN